MASFWLHESVTKVMSGAIDLDTDAAIKMGLWTEDEAGVKDDEFVSDLGTEVSDTNYTAGFGNSGRKALTGKICNDDPTNDRAVWDDTNDYTWSALGGTDTVAWAVIMKEDTSDAASPLIVMLDVDPNYLTTGGDFTIQFAAGATLGIGYIAT